MIRRILIFVAAVSFSFQVLAQGSEGRRVDVIIESQSLENNFPGDSPKREVSIYIPAEYDLSVENHYPVLYLLHGYSLDPDDWFNQFYPGFNLKSTMDRLIEEKLISPMIIVAPDSKNSYMGSWYTNSTVSGNWEDFIVKDLVKYIDDNYRTIPTVKSRGIAGHSMGGYGALKLSMKFPGIFGSVYSMSGALNFNFRATLQGMRDGLLTASRATEFDNLYWTVQGAIAMAVSFSPDSTLLPFYCEFPINDEGSINDTIWAKWLLHDVTEMIPFYKDSLAQLRAIQFDCGTSDPVPYNENILFSNALTKNNIEHVFKKYEGDHINKIGQRMEAELLPFFSGNLEHSLSNITSTESNSLELFQVFPNPTSGLLTIQTGGPGIYSLEISFMNGQKVLNRDFRGSSLQVDLSSLQEGIYMMIVRSKDYIHSETIIKH